MVWKEDSELQCKGLRKLLYAGMCVFFLHSLLCSFIHFNTDAFSILLLIVSPQQLDMIKSISSLK